MFLHEVDAKYFKGFDRIKIPFKSNFSILSGPNGVGKSSVLFAISSAMTLSNGQLPLNENTQCKIEYTNRDDILDCCGFGPNSYKMLSRRVSQFLGGLGIMCMMMGHQRTYINMMWHSIFHLFLSGLIGIYSIKK